MSNEYRNCAIEHFWGGEDDETNIQCRGAQVISYLRRELECTKEVIQESLEENQNNTSLYNSLIEVINFIADCSDNEDMRVEEEDC